MRLWHSMIVRDGNFEVRHNMIVKANEIFK